MNGGYTNSMGFRVGVQIRIIKIVQVLLFIQRTCQRCLRGLSTGIALWTYTKRNLPVIQYRYGAL